MSEAKLDTGMLINNRYHIQEKLGQGGFGRTYLAADNERFEELCVLKEFVPNTTKPYAVQRARELFEREARTLYKINHPQIPKFLSWFEYSDSLFIVQEYIHGKTYLQLLNERLSQQGKAFSELEIHQWLHGLLPVLAYLHDNSIVHRDISPENIMLPNGQSHPVLIDFGLVKQTVSQIWALAANQPGLAAETSFVGKFGYSPPEQIRMGQCYPCSDLYSLAVTAIVLLTGREPSALMNYSLEWQWQAHTKVSTQLADILNTMLREKPSDRYQSAKDILTCLPPIAPVLSAAQSFATIKIEIDETHKNLQLAEIEETDYFKHLHAEAELLRLSLYNEPDLPPEDYSPDRTLNADVVAVSQFEPTFLEHCHSSLSRYVGVMSTCILEDAIAEYPEVSASELVEILADEIPNPQQATEFKQLLTPLLQTEASSQSVSEPVSQSFTADVTSDYPARSLDPAFLDHCQQTLSRYVGMMATCILEDTIADYPTASESEFIDLLAKEIPNPQQAAEFKQSLDAILHPPDVSMRFLQVTLTEQQDAGLPEPATAPLDPTFLECCQQTLSRYIGMMATCILEDTIADYPTASESEFIDLLAKEIPNPRQAAEFKQSLTADLQRQSIAQHGSRSRQTRTSLDRRTAATSAAPAQPVSQPPPPPDWIALCQQELSRCIGPMAKYLVEDALNQQPPLSALQLIDALAAKIPNSQQAAEFRQRLRQQLNA